jgi:hypothetical protein
MTSTVVLAQGLAIAQPAAHGGLTNVPQESTYLLDKGERVLSPRQNTDLTEALENGGLSSTKGPIILQLPNGRELMRWLVDESDAGQGSGRRKLQTTR